MNENTADSSSSKTTPSPRKPLQTLNLSELSWTVAGYMPTSWTGRSMEMGFALPPEIPPVPVSVPGSVQGALRAAGLLPDWFEGLNARACEWVENRDWMFSAALPDAWFHAGSRFILRCGGLDGNGVVIFNKRRVGAFDNAFVPHEFDLSPHVLPSGNELHIVFFTPPRWLGQVGYTSQMKEWKPRFNYTWDWIPRLVQTGPWEPVTLEISGSARISTLRCRTDFDLATTTGTLWLRGEIDDAKAANEAHRVRLTLRENAESGRGSLLKTAEISVAEFAAGVEWNGLLVKPWQTNSAAQDAVGKPISTGSEPTNEDRLYQLDAELLDAAGTAWDQRSRRVGFRHIAWQACENAPAGADPWVCVVNGSPTFLQGIDWTPIRPTFADLRREDYQKLVETYARMGCNFFRVWGGAFLEKTWLYDLCDEHGILVWQEFPLSSSGHENWPHEDEPSIAALERIAASYIERRQHHASLLLWCGGNELQGDPDGGKTGTGKPVGLGHPLMRRWAALVDREDPGRRFLPTSSSGPRFIAFAKNFGKGEHWDVHGPWKAAGETPEETRAYWRNDDALFRSETGAPGASSAALIRRYSGGLPTTPGTMENPLWRRFAWWLEWADFVKEMGREPASLEEYAAWSQSRQAALLRQATIACKRRFPGIGGLVFWMGHDAFPCTSNTSLLDFHGEPKPAALAVSEIWRTPANALESLTEAGR